MKNVAVFTVLNYPNEDDFFKILDELERFSVGYVEVGIPVENPYVDGDLIQTVHKKVLQQPLSFLEVERVFTKIKALYNFKVILMTYQSGVVSFDLDKLNHELYDGIICVDNELCPKVFNQPVYIFNEDLNDEVLERYIKCNSTFNYVMSGRGKTGSFTTVPTEYIETIQRIKIRNSEVNNFVGFGIKTKKDIETVIQNGADGAIIGTEFIKRLEIDGINGIVNYLEELS